MDADTKGALDAAADVAMREYQTQDSRERALSLKAVLTDGVCRIVEVQDQLHPPCVGLIHTDLGEKFPVFSLYVREQAKSLSGKRVKLTVQMSERGTRYVTGMMAMPPDATTDLWACPRCGGMAERRERGTYPNYWYTYNCVACAYQMEVGP